MQASTYLTRKVVMQMARYGMPWQGSKSRIAEWVVDVLPPSHTLVDLFGGGVRRHSLRAALWQVGAHHHERHH